MAFPLKNLERLAKVAAAFVVAALLWRPGRNRGVEKRLRSARRVLVLRLDNRVGEALLTTPLLDALASRPELQVTVVVHEKVARVLAQHPRMGELLAFDRRLLWLGPLAPGVLALRRARFDVVVHATNWSAPSLGGAIVARLSAPRGVVVGPKQSLVARLQDVDVAPRDGTRSEAAQRVHLLSPLLGERSERALSFRAPQPSPEVARLAGGAPYAVVNPGGRLGIRRVPAEAFSAGARAALELGLRAVVTWGPGEEGLASEVVRGAPGAELAPPTRLDDLAALMQGAHFTLCNNTGPMHLSVAVGAPTLGLFLRMEMERWGHPYPPHRMVDLTPLVESGGGVDVAVGQEVASFVATLGGLKPSR